MGILDNAAAFSGGLTKREVTWKLNGEEYNADVWVRPLSYASAVETIVNKDADAALAVAARIAYSIRNEDGSAMFEIGDITGENNPERGALCESLTFALLAVIGESNTMGKPQT